MSNVTPFDTLAMALALRDEAGFDQKQAEGTAKVLSRLLVADLVTKSDLERETAIIRSDVARLEATSATKQDLAETKVEILKWLIGLIGFQTIAVLGGVAALIKLIH